MAKTSEKIAAVMAAPIAHDHETDQIMNGLTGVFQIGKCYFVRTVTDYWTGRLEKVHELPGNQLLLQLSEGAWIADTGRLSEMVAGRIDPEESEYVGDVLVAVSAGCAFLPWPHKLPKTK